MTCVPPLRTRLSLLYTPANQPHRSARRYDDVTFLVSVDRDLLEEIASKHVGMSEDDARNLVQHVSCLASGIVWDDGLPPSCSVWAETYWRKLLPSMSA